MVGRTCTVLLSVTSGGSSGRQGQGFGVLGLRGISVMTKQSVFCQMHVSQWSSAKMFHLPLLVDGRGRTWILSHISFRVLLGN